MNDNPNAIIGQYSNSFPTMTEVQQWFDKNFCSIDGGVTVCGNIDQARMRVISQAVSPDRHRKLEWMRREGNEEWYAPRISLLQSAWNWLRQDHEQIVSAMNAERKKVDEELVKANSRVDDFDAENRRLREQNKSFASVVDELKAGKIKSTKEFLRKLRRTMPQEGGRHARR